MKWSDDIRAKIGDDKLLHFLLFGLVVAFGFFFSWMIGVLTFFLVFSLSLVKEFLDDFFNLKDLVAGVLGGITTCIVYSIITKIILPL